MPDVAMWAAVLPAGCSREQGCGAACRLQRLFEFIILYTIITMSGLVREKWRRHMFNVLALIINVVPVGAA
jgi:hypothetical protein